MKETVKAKHPQLLYEAKLLRLFQGGEGIPILYWFGEEGDFRIMVTDLLGPSLEDLFNYSKRKFTLKTVLMLAEQFLERLQFLHDTNFIHRDVKPENFLMGLGKKADKLFIIDFGLAKKYRDPRTGMHIPNKADKTLTGTARYASINSHLGIEQSRRDDLEALAYVLIYFLRGDLPWQGIQLSSKKEIYEKILEKKVATPIEVLCEGLPEEFGIFLKYSKSLKFEERPDYTWSKRLFKELVNKMNFQMDLIFDWAVISITIEKELEEQNKIIKKKVLVVKEMFVTGVLKINLVGCKNLPRFDMTGFSDPYSLLSLIKSNGELLNPAEHMMMATEVQAGEKFQRKTAVINDSNNPIWNYQCEMMVCLKDKEFDNLRMLIEVFDYDTSGDEFIGDIKIDLRKIWKKPGLEKTITGTLKDNKGNEWKECEIEVKFIWNVLS